jgi:hypothetical protein
MDVFFAMGVPGANPNDASFFLRLPHLWPMFVIPIVCFYAFLGVWVVSKVRDAIAAECHAPGTGASGGARSVEQQSGASGTEKKPSDTGPDTLLFDLNFYHSGRPTS